MTTISSLVVYNTTNWHELVLSHVHAAFGPDTNLYNITAPPMLAPDLLCDDNTLVGLDFANHVVLVPRGECAFYDKVIRAQQYNARAVIVGNRDDSLIIMGGDTPVDKVRIHSVLVRSSVFAYLRQNAVPAPTPTQRLLATTTTPPPTPPQPSTDSPPDASEASSAAAATDILVAVTHVGAITPDLLPWDTLRLAALFSLVVPAIIVLVMLVRLVARVWRQRVVRHLTVDVGQALPVCVFVAGEDAPLWPPIARELVKQSDRQSSEDLTGSGSGGLVRSSSLRSPRGYAPLEEVDGAAAQRPAPASAAPTTIALLDTVLKYLTESLPAPQRARSLVSASTLPAVYAVAASSVPQLEAGPDAVALEGEPLALARVPGGVSLRCDKVHNSACSVCLEDFSTGDRVKVLPCKHAYHPQCIDEWLASNNHNSYRPNLVEEYDQTYTLDIAVPGSTQAAERAGSGTVHGSGSHCCPVCKASVLAGMERERWEHAPWWVKLYRVVCACELCSRHVQAR